VMEAPGLVLGVDQRSPGPVSEPFEHAPTLGLNEDPCQDSVI
jgi:hypothetical protein